MNITQRGQLQEGSPEREDIIYKLATQKMKDSPDWRPIRIELTKHSINSFMWAGHDGFRLDVQDAIEQGRSRTVRSLTIVDQFQYFVEHPEYAGMIKVIPATEHNIALLARQYHEGNLLIHEDDIRERVEALSKEFLEAAAKSAKKTANKLQAQGDNADNRATVTSSPEQQPPASVPDEDEDGESDIEVDDDVRDVAELRKIAKERVFSRHAVEIQRMKTNGVKRVDLTKDFASWMDEEMKRQPVGV